MQQNRDEEYLTASTFNLDSPPPEAPVHHDLPQTQEWKQEISARVRAHRNRTSRVPANQPPLPGMEEAVSPVAARVAERYARLPSYREMLAAQAAAAESAIDSHVTAATPAPADQGLLPASAAEPHIEFESPSAAPAPEPWQPDLIRYSVSSDSLPPPRSTPAEARVAIPTDFQSANDPFCMADPMEAAVIEPTLPLPAHVVTSPRELVAQRKARPRLAEGPLTDDPPAHPAALAFETQSVAEGSQPMPHSFAEDTQSRDAGVLSSVSPVRRPSAPTAPEWRSIHLDTEAPIREPKSSFAAADGPILHVASLEDRVFAGLVDTALTLSAFLLFALVFALCSTSLPHGRSAFIGAAATLFAMWLLYQLLFFTLTDATPGMHYAKIALCTFDDDNPRRNVLRARIAAQLLSALPLGLGFLWVLFDEDSLGWHDRITRTYQRSYRED
jgi:uncharacterized RDD family membrane protein YckC